MEKIIGRVFRELKLLSLERSIERTEKSLELGIGHVGEVIDSLDPSLSLLLVVLDDLLERLIVNFFSHQVLGFGGIALAMLSKVSIE